MKEKFQKIYESMAQKGKAPVALFALLRMDDLVNKWSVVYAHESGKTEQFGKEIFNDLLEEIKKELTADDLNQIARIVGLDTEDHLAKSLLRYQTGDKISNEQVNGNFVHEGYVFKSQRNKEQVEKAIPSVASESVSQEPKARDSE
ncbi:MAG TPA: hypothetical protein VN495_02605 [Candidatus Paceibacterota bacterium]|nr:hypothetical protein [Candidatus Paceibacterota bacterium]